MRPRETSAVAMILPLLLSLLLLGLLAGCSGGDQSGNQSGNQSGAGQKQEGKAGGKAAKQKRLSGKIAIGTVRAYKDDRRRLSLRPASKKQGNKPLGFKVRKHAQVTLDGKQAGLEDIKEGQQAQIRYVVVNGVNRAKIVQLFSKPSSSKGENRKQPSGGHGKEQPSGNAKKTG